MNTCKVPNHLFADPADPSTYRNILESWFDGIQVKNPGLTITKALSVSTAKLAQFHATLNTKSNTEKLPSYCRSFRLLSTALEGLFFPEIKNQPVTLKEVIRDRYLDNGIITKEHRRVMEEIFNEMFQ